MRLAVIGSAALLLAEAVGSSGFLKSVDAIPPLLVSVSLV
jgi:hypothetical protein